ncbi:MAG TPA: sigma 54-interacting transcriptional regulator [Vicinamibacterales bacterium]|nr:sigma 54-interacting transcriptional regulator [Vicinamibacterales bacterium]
MLLARLRRLLAAKNVRFCELPGTPPSLHVGQPVRSRGYIACPVPSADPTKRLMLEASFDAQVVDDWSCQVLQAAASLATMIIEAERLARLHEGETVRSSDGAAPLIGSSAAMGVLRDRVERVATTDFTVLIEGESGTGKELVARQIHELSRRRQGPFVAINCAALVETLIEAELFGIEERTATGVRGRRGKFEHADGGTLFLDEVAELSMAAQAKLLRAIQDLTVERVGGVVARRVDTRIVVATNRPLAALCEKGLFRSDLYYRLSGVDVRVPPLRSRKEDIMELALYFLSRHGGRRRLLISPAASDALLSYDWPGNVRELERMVEGAIATCDGGHISLDDLPIALRGAYGDVLMPSVHANETMRAWGSRYARLILERCDRNKRRACSVLGISYHTLNAYLKFRPQDRPRPLTPQQSARTAAEVVAAPSEVGLG